MLNDAVWVEPARMGTLSRSLMLETVGLVGTMGMELPIRTLPDGLMVLAEEMAETTSSGDML